MRVGAPEFYTDYGPFERHKSGINLEPLLGACSSRRWILPVGLRSRLLSRWGWEED